MPQTLNSLSSKALLCAIISLVPMLSACELNSTHQIQTDPHTISLIKPAILIFGAHTFEREHRQISFARVHENGMLVGAGCFLYDHVIADARGRTNRYFAFAVPAGIYSLEQRSGYACDPETEVQGAQCKPFPKAFRLQHGHTYYLGDYYTWTLPGRATEMTLTGPKPDYWTYINRDLNLRSASEWARGRFKAQLEIPVISPNTPGAFPFVCTP